jgi:outer membrane lipoprotein SlyB
MTRALKAAVAALALTALAGCAGMGGGQALGEEQAFQGRVTHVKSVELAGDQPLGVGGVMGAVAGGLVGSAIGAGTGKDVAIVLGALAGGYAGQKIQNTYYDKRPGQHVMVQLDNGVAVAVTQPTPPEVRVGQRVWVQGSGADARVVPQD